MKVCIFTLGSRGDIQPYVALGQALIQAGHEAAICTGDTFRSFIEDNGVSFIQISSDLMAIAQTPEGKAVLEHPVRNFRKTMKLTKDVINPAYRKTLKEFFCAAKDADCIVYHPKALGAVDIANYYGIPCISMPPVPITYPITEFPNLALTTKNLGARLNHLSYQINAKAESSQISLINDFREKTLKQEKRKPGIYAFRNGEKEIPTVYPLSPSLFPDVKDWDGHVYVPGFFFMKEKKTELPEEVRGFIRAGRRPVAVTFSSMPLADPKRFLCKLRAAVAKTDDRVILLTGNSGIECENDERIFSLPEISHQLLFSCVKGVIHHGGIGTLAAALRAGIPQMIIPFSVDQPFWAARLRQLGLGLAPLREKELTAASLTEALREMDRKEHIEKAVLFAQTIRDENGVQKAVTYLERIMKGQDAVR